MMHLSVAESNVLAEYSATSARRELFRDCLICVSLIGSDKRELNASATKVSIQVLAYVPSDLGPHFPMLCH